MLSLISCNICVFILSQFAHSNQLKLPQIPLNLHQNSLPHAPQANNNGLTKITNQNHFPFHCSLICTSISSYYKNDYVIFRPLSPACCTGKRTQFGIPIKFCTRIVISRVCLVKYSISTNKRNCRPHMHAIGFNLLHSFVSTREHSVLCLLPKNNDLAHGAVEMEWKVFPTMIQRPS